MFLSILKKTLAPFGIILVIVVAILLARSRFPFLRAIPSWVFLLALAAVLVGWVVFLLVKWIMERRSAEAIEQGILDQAQANIDQAPPARRSEIQELRRNMAEALALLKKGPQGKKALYTLPWYLIIGPPAIGKTTVVKNSNLNFPGMTTAKLMRGSGGTRNCDWWFSTDAILLDTAGRYAEDVDRSETEAEWFAFLDLLKTQRKHGPIDGLILGYSIEAIYEKDEVELVNSARELRQRMDEILDRLGWTFPVYVLFTKCDLISGFADYFSPLSPIERQQVWGAVYSPQPEGDQQAAARFSEQFDLLVANLRNMRPRRMSSISRSEDWGRVFMFPEEFANLKDRLLLFIETLFEPNPFRRDLPIFRGTYFSSGKQEGRPFDLVVRKIQSMLGAPVDMEEPQEQEEKQDAYFVRDLFTKVLKTDRDLVRLTGVAARRRARLALFASTGFLALSILACVWIGVSYGRLRSRMNGIEKTSLEMVEVMDQPPSGTIEKAELQKLENLRRRITGSWRSFPLIVTDAVRESGRDVYHQAITRLILGRVEGDLADRLRYPDGLSGGEVRRGLRAELMLLMPQKGDSIGWNARELSEGLLPYGFKDISPRDEEAREYLPLMVEEFLDLERPVLDPDLRRDALRRAADRLALTHRPQEFLAGVVVEASVNGQDLALGDLVSGQSILASDRIVRAAYTREGWRERVEPEIRHADRTVEADNRLIVLARGRPTERPPAPEELLDLYTAQYPREWADFLASVHLRSYGSCQELKDDIWKLQDGRMSPLFSLLRRAWDAASLESGAPASVLPDDPALQRVRTAFIPLKELVEASDDQPARLDDYAQKLGDVYLQVDHCAERAPGDREAFTMAGRWLDHFSQGYGDPQVARALKELLLQPVEVAERRVRGDRLAGARRSLQQEWTTARRFFQDRLAGAYPFGDGRDADMHDVVDFFGPDGKLAGFAEYLQQHPLVDCSARTKRALAAAERIRRDLDMSGDGFKVSFKMKAGNPVVRSTGTAVGDRNVARIEKVTLTINDGHLEDLVRGTERTFTWRSTDADPRCLLELESIAQQQKVGSIDFEGIWSICRLFDVAEFDDRNQGRLVTWAFPGKDIEVDFLLTWPENREPFFLPGSPVRGFTLPESVFE
jgi:type VI secretion system IcmF/VasK family protein